MSAAATPDWAQVPAPTPGRRELPAVAVEALAVLVAAVGPVARSLALPEGDPLGVLGVIAGATLAAGALRGRRWWWARLLLAVAAAGLVALLAGELLGVWTAAGVVLADWGVRRRPPVPGLPAPSAAVLPGVVVVMAVAAWRGRLGLTGPDILFWPVLAGVLVLVGTYFGHRLQALVAVVGSAAGRAVTWVAFGLLAVPLVLVPWAVHRIAGTDPLAPGRRAGTSWHERRRRDRQVARPWAPDGVVDTRTWGRRVRFPAVAAALVLLVVLAARSLAGGPGDPASTEVEGAAAPDGVPAAYAGEDWYPDYSDEIQWIINQRTAFRPLHPLRIRDVESTWVNVADGVRRTWRPPDCGGCRRLTVWVYGGSTTFGLGQRDEWTIPSQLARIAARDGLTLDVVNRGVPGDLHWQEANRFAWDLTVDPAPDLVIFYDGVNEIWGAQSIANLGSGDPRDPVEPLTEDLWQGYLDVAGGPVPPAPDGAEVVPTTTVPGRSGSEIGRLAVTRYERSRAMSRDTAAARGIPAVWFWQPSRLSRPPVPGEPAGPGQAYARDVYAAAESNVPDGVVDLTRSLDDVPGPLFSDDVHHNEVAAAALAEDIWAVVGPQLRRLAAEPGSRS